jgi:hypothetical protein
MPTDELTPPQQPSLSPIQERVALSLASGATVTGAAEEAGINRVTVYRWLKGDPAFADAVQQNRADFILSRRDDLHHLTNRAMETLLAILDNPRSSTAVLLRTSMFILQRSQNLGSGWCMPERLPEPVGPTLTDSAVLEKECDRLACIDGLEPEKIDDAIECNTMQPETENMDDDDEPAEFNEPDEPETCEYPYSHGILPSCPVPAHVLQRRNVREQILAVIDHRKSLAG